MGAVILKQSNPGFIDRHGVAADALDKQIDALRVRYNNIPLLNSQFFKKVEPRGGVYKESTFGTSMELPRLNEDSDELPFATPWKGFPKSITILTYRLACAVERALPEDQLIDVAKKMMSGLINSGRLLIEYSMANVFNNYTSSSYVGGDGMPLGDTAHPFERRQQGTWSNEETAAALTTSTLQTMRANMRKRTNEYGYPTPIKPVLIMVPPDLERKVYEILNSELVPENALNAKNWFKGSLTPVINDYLTSTTVYMLKGDIPDENSGLLYAEEVAPNIAPTEGADRSTDIIWGERLRMRFGVGFNVDKNWQFNAGS